MTFTSIPSSFSFTPSPRDVRLGQASNVTNCPIARAAKRALRKLGLQNNLVQVGVSFLSVYTRRSKKRIAVYALPNNAQDFILAIDSTSPGNRKHIPVPTVVATLKEVDRKGVAGQFVVSVPKVSVL